VLEGLARVLHTDERARAARYVREADRRRSVAARALLRVSLSRDAQVRPDDWRFIENRYGRPQLAEVPAGAEDLRFNVSHTDGLIAVTVARGRDVGVDVECTERTLSYEIPERFFAPDEVRDLRARPTAEQPEAFFDYWTLKEAYIKARGMGLALPLHGFAFHLRPGAPPRIAFTPDIPDDPSRWQFVQARPGPRHRLAVAVERRGPDIPVHLSAVSLADLATGWRP
jgi:4'-phosphopantetheinyl transferase